MLKADTDRDWETFGHEDPYYAVLTDDKYRRGNLTDENRRAFFDSGRQHVDRLMRILQSVVAPDLNITRALEFGCGVGRLLIPISRIAREATGVDVSDAMLAEARRNCLEFGADNVVLAKSDDRLSCLQGQYDLIHSFIVFQHVPVSRGMVLFARLLDHLATGGVAAIHFTYAKRHRKGSWKTWMKAHVPLTRQVANLMNGRPFFAPDMQMNSYDLNQVMQKLQNTGVRACHAEFTDHGGMLGVVLYFKKAAPRP